MPLSNRYVWTWPTAAYKCQWNSREFTQVIVQQPLPESKPFLGGLYSENLHRLGSPRSAPHDVSPPPFGP